MCLQDLVEIRAQRSDYLLPPPPTGRFLEVIHRWISRSTGGLEVEPPVDLPVALPKMSNIWLWRLYEAEIEARMDVSQIFWFLLIIPINQNPSGLFHLGIADQSFCALKTIDNSINFTGNFADVKKIKFWSAMAI